MNQAELRRRFEEVGADWSFSYDLLKRLNEGSLSSPPVHAASFPPLDGKQLIDLRGDGPWSFDRRSAEAALQRHLPVDEIRKWIPNSGTVIEWNIPQLEALGLRLSSVTAFGVLNGGMATSYADNKKNQSLNPNLYSVYRSQFETMIPRVSGLPKGMTPAFLQTDGTEGPSYLELKLRALAQINMAARLQGHPGPGLQFFQMTSAKTHESLLSAYRRYESAPALHELLKYFPQALDQTPTAKQDLISTFTSAKDGSPRKFFLTKKGGKDVPYALPGGHGQNFRILKSVYRQLLSSGYRFAYLGNVDNLGFLPSLKGLALLALSGAPAAFDFSFKTPVDVKGGVLYRGSDGRLNCADIGVAISSQEVTDAESLGTPILFNCATGLFDLERLVADIDRIIELLPVRLSEQDKDLGRYAQVEQVTWEIIGLLEGPVIFGVEKNRRFLASKLLLDCFLTSGLGWEDPKFLHPELVSFRALSASLNAGLRSLLEGPFGYRFNAGVWSPQSEAELQRRLMTSGFDRISV